MILCCGEALIDMLPRTLPGGESAFMPVAGGAVFNTAIALARLGEKTGFYAGLSTDSFGTMLSAALDKAGIDCSLCLRAPLPTTLAFVSLVAGQARYLFYDENTAGRMLDPGTPPVIAASVTAMHFGAISLVGEPCGSAYEKLALREAPRRVISLDPNIRPQFVTDEISYRARLERLLDVADIVKVSAEDLEWLAPGIPFEIFAEAQLSRSASVVVLTRGELGALAATRAGIVECPSVPVAVVDTVGAGDAFNAGVLAGLARSGLLSRPRLRKISRDELLPVLRLAVRVGAITVSRAGADPPFAHEL